MHPEVTKQQSSFEILSQVHNPIFNLITEPTTTSNTRRMPRCKIPKLIPVFAPV